MLDEGFMAEARAKTVQQERRSVRSVAACSQLSLFSGRMEGLCRDEAKRKVDFRRYMQPCSVQPVFTVW